MGTRLTMIDAYKRDLDFWGNGERGLYNVVTRSISAFMIASVPEIRDNTMSFWCDIGCGPGYFLEGVVDQFRERGHRVIPSGVDVSPEALARCRRLWEGSEFAEMDLDNIGPDKPSPGPMPWVNADVVSFIDTLQYFKNYRKTFNEILRTAKPFTIFVVADGMIRSNLRDYPNSLPNVARLASWTDTSMPVSERKPGEPHSKNIYLKYRIYRKML